MSVAQIVLMVIGAVMFILSFIIPERKNRLSNEDKRLTEKQIRDIVEVEMQDFHARVSDIVDETISYAVEKSERSMEKLTNEKIMAVSEYSDTVLEEIHKNHEEVVFLYDMLNDKHKDLTSVASEVERTARQAKNVVTASDYVQQVQPGGMPLNNPNDQMRSGAVPVNNQVPQQTAAGGFTPFITRVDMNTEADSILSVPDQSTETVNIPGIESMAGIANTMTAENPAGAALEDVPQDSEPQTPKKRGRKPGKAKDKQEKAIRIPDFPVVEKPAVALSFQGNADDNKNNNQRILALHKEGKSNVAIARELGLGVGEVKLVIDLFKR